MSDPPRVALDFSTLDTVNPASGQYRYVTSLVRGLAALEPRAELLVIGSRAEPVPELEDLFAAGGGLRWVRFQPGSGPGAWLRDSVRLGVLLRRERVSVFHTPHGSIPVPPPCPVVVTVHDLMHELFPEYAAVRASRRHRWFRWLVRRAATRVIAISRSTASDLERLWAIDPQRIDVVLHGLPLRGEPRAIDPDRLPLDPANLVLSSPYNLEPRRNLAALVEAFACVRRDFPGLRLVLFGRAAVTPEREQEFEALLGRLDLGSSVLRTGLLEDAQLAWLYRRSAVFVFPSPCEGFGYPVLEAMAQGTCVLARGASAMLEVGGEAIRPLAAVDAGSLASGITELLRDPAARARLGTAARARAGDFPVERMAQATWDCYCRAYEA